jgi:hypothetical protein
VARRVRAAGGNLGVVVQRRASRRTAWGWGPTVRGEQSDEDHVVLGVLDGPGLEGDPAAPVEEAMRSGPTTMRPHLAVEKVARSLRSQQRDHVLVTTSNRRLLGLLWLKDAEQRSQR